MTDPTDKVTLSEYQASWPEQFEKVAAAIKAACGELIQSVDHIGSTSIPGMRAKNIIDIQCGLDNFDSINSLAPKLQALGFALMEEVKQDHVPYQDFDYFEPGWEKRFFKGQYQQIACNIHLRIKDSPNWQFALDFKHYLIHNTAIAKAYEQVKTRLEQAGVDLKTYTLIKDPVCDLIYTGFYKLK